MKLVIIGFATSYKSTVAKYLSHKLNIPLLDIDKLIEAQAGATRGDYRVISWTSSLAYAVKNNLKNFPEKCPYQEVIRGIGAAHPEYWYVE